MFEWIAMPEAWIALATLTALEIVLGIDNIIFISILVGRLPEHQRDKARTIGLGLAMGTRLLLLFSLTWVMTLTDPLFSVFAEEISGRDLILLLGGLFLLGKSTLEIHHALEGESQSETSAVSASFAGILVQIAILDVVFSLDSVITAVGLADQLSVMVIAVVISVGVMLLAAKSVSDFVDKHPTIKMLALSFLILIGMTLIGEGFGFHVPKGYVYFAMAFSLTVEMLNLKIRANRKKTEPVHLRKSIPGDKHPEN
ncbi:TerC family protein [Idiomarina sp. HP20-50]|uniref:TerC family protein n=1 Tax=Idiomarina sp. HP20-50 TaxID=3070813 RepID=UPI00294B1D07|nr:TerC family protein [Idiomarina sp. HP20-50]MDV6314982.1 TerC family protein [Idiomarina sp. HP20-50]